MQKVVGDFKSEFFATSGRFRALTDPPQPWERRRRVIDGRFAPALDALDPEFLLANGDSWIDADLTTFSRAWERNRANHFGALAQLLLHAIKNAEWFGIVETRDGTVVAFREKGSRLAEGAQLINAGVYVFRRELVVEAPPRSELFRQSLAVSGRTRVSGLSFPQGR